jgi:CRISPR-associated endoribonuclease Cas2 subtype I-E
MAVLVANYTPPAIRGMLKRWFVEPKPNVFVSTVNPRTRDKVLDYVKRNVQGMLPTRVGMVRNPTETVTCSTRAPHNAWGWSALIPVARAREYVLPTCVGMVLNQVLVLLFENNQLKIA